MGIMDLEEGEQNLMEGLSESGATLMHTNGSETVIYPDNGLPAKKHDQKLSWSPAELQELWKLFLSFQKNKVG